MSEDDKPTTGDARAGAHPPAPASPDMDPVAEDRNGSDPLGSDAARLSGAVSDTPVSDTPVSDTPVSASSSSDSPDPAPSGSAPGAPASAPPSAEHPLPDDDTLLEAAAIAEEDPAEVAAGDTPRELHADEEIFVDGTVGRSEIAAERDEFREAFMRVKADFENYKKRSAKEHAERVARAAEGLVSSLIPVLDGCEAAIAQGATDVEPIVKHLLDVLEKEGLELIDPTGAAFDPEQHEAVLHEPGDGGEPTVVETMRTGYAWKGRVIRPAMVKVRD